MSSVSFTKDLSSENRKNGEFLLGYYYRNSKLSKRPYYPATNYPALIKYLDEKYPTYIHSLGENLKYIESDKVIEAVTEAAKNADASFNVISPISNALLKYGRVTSSDALSNAATEIGNDILSYASIFSKVVIWGGIAFVGFYLFKKSGAKLPASWKL